MVNLPANQVQSTLKKFILADGMHVVFNHQKSHGPWLYDDLAQKEYLDLFSFFATQPVGFNHPYMSEPNFVELLGQLAIHKPTLSDVYTTQYASSVETFARVAGQGMFEHYFFVEGGAMGVENALKAAFDWKYRKNLARGLDQTQGMVIHFENAFHGRSGYTLSLTNTYDPRKHMYFPKFNWPRIISPALSFPLNEDNLKNTIALENIAIDQIHQALRNHPNQIAALIIEPVQSEGGDRHFRKEFLLKLRDLSHEHEFLLIFDEVQTGIGLTGKMWAFEHFNLIPDLISFGKKVQVAGCASSRRIDEIQDNVFKLNSRINSTWGGNLIDFIRLERYMEIIERENLVHNAMQVGQYFIRCLEEWAKTTQTISNVRGRGLLISFDCKDSEHRQKMHQKIFECGALTLTCGEKSIRVRPHLDLTKEHVNKAMDIFSQAQRLA